MKKNLFLFLLFLFACSPNERADQLGAKKENQTGEIIYRKQDEFRYRIPPPSKRNPPVHPF
jgi:hypothetical protein